MYDIAIVCGGVIGRAAPRELSNDHDIGHLERGHLAAGRIAMTSS